MRRLACSLLAAVLFLPPLARTLVGSEDEPSALRRVFVLDAVGGEPLAGFEVEFRHSATGKPLLFDPVRRWAPWVDAIVTHFFGAGAGRVAVTRAKTDAAGIAGYFGPATADVSARNGEVVFAGRLENPSHGDSPSTARLVRAGLVSGRVVDEAGTPIAGVAIAGVGSARPEIGWLGRDSNVALPVVFTDSRGEFRLPPIPDGTLVAVVARRPGLVPAKSPRVAVRAGAVVALREALVLRDQIALDVRVVDERGVPVPFARVLHGDPAHNIFVFENDCRETLTDPFGRATIGRGLDPRRLVVVKAFGYPAKKFGPLDESEFPLTVVIDKPASISGRVVDARGEPIADAFVSAWVDDADPHSFFLGRDVRTGVDGRFEFTGLAPGDYTVNASPGASRLHTRVTIPPNATDIEFVAPCGEIRGVAIDAETGEPVRIDDRDRIAWGGEWVVADGGRRTHRYGKFTDAATGEFVVSELDEGEYRVNVWANGYRVATTDAIRMGRAETVSGVRLVMEKAPAIRGVVVDAATGLPVAGAAVRAELGLFHDPESDCFVFTPEFSLFSSDATTNDQGEFSVRLNSLGLHWFSIRKKDYASESRSILVTGATEPAEVRVELARPIAVTGTVFRDGAPVAGCGVTGVHAIDRVVSDADGRFRLLLGRPGPHLVWFGVGRGISQCAEMDVPPEGLEHDLVFASASVSIAGSARFSDGPAAHAGVELLRLVGPGMVSARKDVRRYDASRTDETGVFEIAGLSTGTYAVTVHHASEWDRTLQAFVTIPDDGFARCDMSEEDGRLEVIALDESGERVLEPFGVSLDWLDEILPRGRQCEDWIAGESGGDGSATLRGLLPGRYRVRVSTRSGLAGWADTDVPRADGTPLAVTIGAAARVTIGLRVADRPTIEANAIFFPHGEGSSRGPIELRREGALAPGIYDVVVAAKDYPPVRVDGVELVAGETRAIVAEAPVAAGRLCLEIGGIPPPGTRVAIRDASGADIAWLAGEFPWYTLAPGPHEVTVTCPDGRSARAATDVAAGETVSLRLEPR